MADVIWRADGAVWMVSYRAGNDQVIDFLPDEKQETMGLLVEVAAQHQRPNEQTH